MQAIRVLGSRGQVFRASLPETRRERMHGWRDRTAIGRDAALLLPRARSIHTLGMRVPISAALLDRDLVVRAVRAVPPGRLVLPRPGIRHVLECSEGVDLRPGDRLRIVESG
jgi:uncharacterized membrane protein (UPF0127 family)